MSKDKLPVILDTDIGTDIDDTWALGLLLKSPELDPKLIVTTTGNTIYRAKLVAKFLEASNRTDIPIGIGPNEKNDASNIMKKTVEDYDLIKYSGVVHQDGINAIVRTIMQFPKIIIIGIGPLGNIAEALIIKPEITKRARFVGMQGSIRIGYKGKPTPDPEYNVFRNINACKTVFEAPWEVTITPLDTCGNIVVEGNNYERMMQSSEPIAKEIMNNYKMWAKEVGKSRMTNRKSSVLYDTVAIYLAFSEELLNMEELGIEITEKGFTKINMSKKKIRCATSWKNEQSFKDLIIERLVT